MRICYSGLRFFFEHVLHRDWHTLKLIHAQREQQLPTVLSREEVRRLLGCVRTPHNDAFLSTVYACGLCCGSAGTYSILQPAPSRPMLHAKVDALEAGDPDLIATASIGCYAYLCQEARVPVVHWVELLV